ncbi:ICMT-domain-containing protein [Epithele typhae]|uniref:ICMT-domain-containing protein n=1 Tax=Epithele typhae TaxID=378194 RepID=UPI002007B086|nr:ICMT-domain-containing protein [Epithele typhae]KAH9930450.1 ICMT-domain-containing protein [Epithele typhae]
MLILQPLVINTPLLKIPLLVTYATSVYGGMTPPAKPSPEKEPSSTSQTDFITRSVQLSYALATTCKCIVGGLALAEAALLVAHSTPPNAISDSVISLLGQGLSVSSFRPSYVSVVGLACATLGGQIRIWCHRSLGKFFTWTVTVQDDHELITSGPYAVVRHPSYLGWLLMVAGNLTYLLDRSSYLIASGWAKTTLGRAAIAVLVFQAGLVTPGLMARMDREDEKMRETFGDRWDAWAERVPYSVIPFIY